MTRRQRVSFRVTIKGGTVSEPNETFVVNVTSVVGATVADGQATSTISNDDGAAISVLLPKSLSSKPTERKTQLREFGQQIDTMLKADPEVHIVLIGGVTVPGLLDLTARAVPAKDALPAERVLVSPALLEEFGKSRAEFPHAPAANEPAQVLQLLQ